MGLLGQNLTNLLINNETVTTDIPKSLVYDSDYIDFELPILVVVTVLFCLSGFVLCTRARRNWNRQYRQRQNTDGQVRVRSSGSPVPLSISAYRNAGFNSSNSNLEGGGSSVCTNPPPAVNQGPYIIPAQMIMPPTYIDLPPSYEDVIKETANTDSTHLYTQEYVDNGIIEESNPQTGQSSSGPIEPSAAP